MSDKGLRKPWHLPEAEIGDIDTSVCYLTIKDLSRVSGYAKQSVWYHLKTGALRGFRFRGRVFVHPEEAKKYISLIDCGILRPESDAWEDQATIHCERETLGL